MTHLRCVSTCVQLVTTVRKSLEAPHRPRSTISTTVPGVYNQQGGVLRFSYERPGLGVVWAVPIDFPPSEVPSTTLVPCQMARMVAGTIDSMVLNCQQLPPLPLGPPHRPPSRFDIILTVILIINSNIPLLLVVL